MIDFRDKIKTKKKTHNYMLRIDQGSKSMSFQNNWTKLRELYDWVKYVYWLLIFFFAAYDWNEIQNHVLHSFRIVCMSGTILCVSSWRILITDASNYNWIFFVIGHNKLIEFGQ